MQLDRCQFLESARAVALSRIELFRRKAGLNCLSGCMYHRQKTAVCVLTEQGKIIKEMEVTSEPDSQIAIPQGLDGIVEAVGLEAGPLSQ
jgi:hypothetical protein